MSNLTQIFTVELNNQDKLFKLKFKIQFQNSIQDCDIVESNSSFNLTSNIGQINVRYLHVSQPSAARTSF